MINTFNDLKLYGFICAFKLLLQVVSHYCFSFTKYIGKIPCVDSGNDIEEVIQFSEEASKILLKLFSDNLMKINADKCYLLVSTSDKVNIDDL